MSAQDRYTKIIESLVNGEEQTAQDLLHEAFVEKARQIWSDLVEQDEIVEDEVSDEDLEEAIGDEEAGDFLDDVEEDEEEIEAEEAFGEADDEEDEGELEMDAEMELATDDDNDFDNDGEMDDHEQDHDDIEDKIENVEDALADLKAMFSEIMGDEDVSDEETEEAIAFESEEEEVDESEEETLEEEAKLSAVSVSHPDNTDGKAGPVGPGMKDPFSHVDSEKSGDDMMSKGGAEKGGKAPAAKKMEAVNPQDVKDLKPAPKAKG
jgi:hypothetical protein